MVEMTDNGRSWLTLNTKPWMEVQVDEYLSAKGVETYLPILHTYVVRRRRKEPTPFFPGYLFAKVDSKSRQYSDLRWTPGLRAVVTFGGRVAWVSDGVITELRGRLTRLDQAGYFDGTKRFCQGEIVKITSGPFKDLEAVFDRHLSKQGRVKVFLEVLGRLTACEVDVDRIEKAG